MYVCLNFPLYISELTEIAREEDENIAQCRGRREKRRWRFNSNSLLSKERKVHNKLIQTTSAAPALYLGCARCSSGPASSHCTTAAALQCWRRRAVPCAAYDTQTSGFDSTVSRTMVRCDCPFCDSCCFIYSALSRPGCSVEGITRIK